MLVAVLAEMGLIAVWSTRLWYLVRVLVSPDKLGSFVEGGVVDASLLLVFRRLFWKCFQFVSKIQVLHRLAKRDGFFFLHPPLAPFDVSGAGHDLGRLEGPDWRGLVGDVVSALAHHRVP
jgi:hypothetical protein